MIKMFKLKRNIFYYENQRKPSIYEESEDAANNNSPYCLGGDANPRGVMPL